jgi:hypothetical protein
MVMVQARMPIRETVIVFQEKAETMIVCHGVLLWLRSTTPITISGNNKLELRADIFNIFNAENLSGYSNNATQSNQIQGGSSASGLHKEMHRHRDSFSLSSLFILIKPISC